MFIAPLTDGKFTAPYNVTVSPDGRKWLYQKNRVEVWRIALPECREEYVGDIGNLPPLLASRLSMDGRYVIHGRNNSILRLTLIENLFE